MQNLDPGNGEIVMFISFLTIPMWIIAFVAKKIFDFLFAKSDDSDTERFVTQTTFYYHIVCLIVYGTILTTCFKCVLSETTFSGIAIVILSAATLLSTAARMIMEVVVVSLKDEKEKKLELLIKKQTYLFLVGNFAISVLMFLLSRFILNI